MIDRSNWPGWAMEFVFLAAGLMLLWRMRKAVTAPVKAPHWAHLFLDVIVFAMVVIGGLFVGVTVFNLALRWAHVAESPMVTLSRIFVFEASGFAAIYLFHVFYRKLKLQSPDSGGILEACVKGAAVFLAALPVVVVVQYSWEGALVLSGHPVSRQDIVEMFQGLNTTGSRVLFALFAAGTAPMIEEIAFRGVIYRGLQNVLSRRLSLILSALLFALAHGDLSSFLPLAALGVIFALAYDATGNIGVPIVAHALFNLNSMVALLMGITS